jgi:MoxR-like ATPase
VTAVYLALSIGRPLLLEGEPGVGKTELAKALASMTAAQLVRLQCYEGIDASQALYEWDYPRQLLVSKSLLERGGDPDDGDPDDWVGHLYTERFLLERPILRAIRAKEPTVLLVDELDRADDEFEAFLLEVLSDYSVSIPELGTIVAPEPPIVIVTSNRTRELHDALKRRCLYHWIDYPTAEREAAIIRLRVPDLSEKLAESVARVVEQIRGLDLIKRPGAAEAIDWAQALSLLGAETVSLEAARVTLGWVAKNHDDLQRLEAVLPDLLGEVDGPLLGAQRT